MKKNRLKEGLDFTLFVGPAFISVVLVTVIPFLLNIYYSFYKWDGIARNMTFVGLKNFVRIFTIDTQFINSFNFTFKFSIVYLVLVNVIAILAANHLVKSSRINNMTRSFFFIPYIISLVAVSLIWEFLLGPGFTYLYEATGIGLFGISWLGNPKFAFASVVIVTIWQNMGFFMIIYIAGFSAIPQSLIEAASIDGANRFDSFFKIKLPLLMPSITVCIFYALTFGLKLFDIILVLTKGGPGNATRTIAFDIYNDAFMSNKYGVATAKSLVFFLVVLVITVIQLRYFKSREVEY